MLLFALYAAAVAVWQWGLGAPGGALVSDLAYLPLSFGVGALAWRTARSPDLDSAARRGWRLIALSYIAYGVGDLLWLYYDGMLGCAATPSLADLFYLTQFPLLLAGLLAFRPGPTSRRQRTAFWLDATTVALVGMVLTWSVLVAPQPGDGDLLAHTLAVAYPTADLLMFVAVALALLQERHDATGRALAVLGVGLLLAFAGDLVYGSQTLVGDYRVGGVPDLLWLLSLVVAGAGAWLGQRPFPAADAAAVDSPIPLHLLPYGAVAICLLVLVAAQPHGATHRALDFATAAVVLCVVLRQLAVLQQNRRLLRREASLRAELMEWAFYDALTHLANRTLLCSRVEQALHDPERRGKAMAMLYLDLDGFKTVNDSLGHRAGDDLLVLVANRLQDCVTPADTVARLGGDEFALYLAAADTDAAAATARRVLEALGAPFLVLGQEVFVQASIGIATGPEEATAAEVLLRNADMAMYTAKGLGKGRFALFEPAMHAALLRRLELEADLRRALEEGQLTLVYQPAVSFQTGRVIGLEALLRWHHPVRGDISPVEFIPLAEETGLIVRLGAWVLREACRQVEQWQQRFPGPTPLVLSVNLSARQLQQAGLVAEVAETLRDFALAPGSLVLEITESILMQSTDAVITTLEALKALGVQIAIDDFGTGYSSLAYLRKFPVDIVKIDRSFIGAVGSGVKESVLVKGIIDIANALGITPVAEGVERPEQVVELAALQCRLGQGYLFGRPVAAEALDSLLAEGAAGALEGRPSAG